MPDISELPAIYCKQYRRSNSGGMPPAYSLINWQAEKFPAQIDHFLLFHRIFKNNLLLPFFCVEQIFFGKTPFQLFCRSHAAINDLDPSVAQKFPKMRSEERIMGTAEHDRFCFVCYVREQIFGEVSIQKLAIQMSFLDKFHQSRTWHGNDMRLLLVQSKQIVEFFLPDRHRGCQH